MPIDNMDQREELLTLTEEIIARREQFQGEIDEALEEYDAGNPERLRDAVRRMQNVDSFVEGQPKENTPDKLRAIISAMEREKIGQVI